MVTGTDRAQCSRDVDLARVRQNQAYPTGDSLQALMMNVMADLNSRRETQSELLLFFLGGRPAATSACDTGKGKKHAISAKSKAAAAAISQN
eukprot:5780272-Amphidinium_carterae.1